MVRCVLCGEIRILLSRCNDAAKWCEWFGVVVMLHNMLQMLCLLVTVNLFVSSAQLIYFIESNGNGCQRILLVCKDVPSQV